jgi:hypothetical protein
MFPLTIGQRDLPWEKPSKAGDLGLKDGTDQMRQVLGDSSGSGSQPSSLSLHVTSLPHAYSSESFLSGHFPCLVLALVSTFHETCFQNLKPTGHAIWQSAT